MSLAYVAVDGPPEAMYCPIVLCDQCGQVVDDAAPGIVLWRTVGGGQVTRVVAHVHKGACDRAYEAEHGEEPPWLWDELGAWLEQLTANTARRPPGLD